MTTLRIIQIVYVVVAIITISGLVTMFGGSRSSGLGDYGYGSLMPGVLFMGLLILIFGNILWRIWCDLILFFSRINKSLNNIDEKQRDRHNNK